MSGASDGTMKAWRIHEYGPPSKVLRLEHGIPLPMPGDGEIRIRVQAFPLNIHDVERINGGVMFMRPQLPYSPGMEVMGVVDACGAGGESWLGRRVAAMLPTAIGAFAEAAIASPQTTFEVPESIPIPGAAAILMPFHLAYMGLIERAKLAAGETVLIHAGAGGAGSAAIQLAVKRGARVIATAGSSAKLELCRALGAELAINYREQGFLEQVLDRTDGKGIDVVFDGIGIAVQKESMDCMAWGGRYVMLGFVSDKTVGDQPSIVPRAIGWGNFSLVIFSLGYRDEATSRAAKRSMPGMNPAPRSVGDRIHAELIQLIQQGEIRPVVGRHVPFTELPGALEAMARREVLGRVVVEV
ncbi:MAG: zinc-binding dehydrogenase [Myxococcota bacterium]